MRPRSRLGSALVFVVIGCGGSDEPAGPDIRASAGAAGTTSAGQMMTSAGHFAATAGQSALTAGAAGTIGGGGASNSNGGADAGGGHALMAGMSADGGGGGVSAGGSSGGSAGSKMSTGGMSGGSGGAFVSAGSAGVSGGGAAGDDSSVGGAPAIACPAGSTLVHDERACGAATDALPASVAPDWADGMRGYGASLGGLAEGTVPCVPILVCAPADAPTLLFSDSPETPKTDGVLYADTVGPGTFRVYVYHANGGASARKFPVVLRNPGTADAHVAIAHKGLVASPSGDYVGIGKQVAADYLASTAGPTVTIPGGTRVLLDHELDEKHANLNDLIHAIYDLVLDAPVKISIVSVATDADAAAATGGLSLLGADGNHDRGTFAGADLLIVTAGDVPGDGVRHLRFGAPAGGVDDELVGTDATTGKPAKLLGNYGMVYRLHLSLSVASALAVSPRGGSWGGAALLASGDDANQGVIQLPLATTTVDDPDAAVFAGRFGAGSMPYAQLMSAGGSNLPVDLVVAPLP